MHVNTREDEIRAASAADARRAKRKTWLLVGFLLLILVGVAVFGRLSQPSLHCIGFDYQTSCTNTP